jgi:hypothetical protein
VDIALAVEPHIGRGTKQITVSLGEVRRAPRALPGSDRTAAGSLHDRGGREDMSRAGAHACQGVTAKAKID